MKLHSLTNTVDRPSRKRVGRGAASLSGKTCGRGQKGYGARTGSHEKAYFEGGQIPLFRRLPKRGFKNPNHKEYTLINVSALEAHFDNGSVIDRQTLLAKGLINDEKSAGLKVLASGELTKSVTVVAERFSKTAVRKIEEAGGTCKTAE
ncbi:MAG: 50S ribosomal protein L15 [Lentisphaeria bacterium]